VVKAAAVHGVAVAVAGLAPYRLAPSPEGGLIFGYSTIAESAIRRGVDLLADAIAELRGSEEPRRGR
jgi:GntR family transcriptional regulator / MocR family aminotransferase